MVKHRRSTSVQGKAKKSKASSEYDADAALSLKESIESGQLGHKELLKLVAADQEPCPAHNKACKGRKDNPNCLCGLVPAPGGFRRKGLWQKEPEAIAGLGHDPNDLRRESTSVPSGLNNLGNTCYVNAALQGLFMIRGFREGLFAVEDSIAGMPVVCHIRRLFAELQEGPKSSADPTSLAEALKLDRGVQQDGQEFFKLLLTLLESKLRGSVNKVIRDLVPGLFRGTYFYETRCQTCGCLSEGSKRATNFYELEAQVKGGSSLEESLARLLSAEHLQGDNKYHCAFCESKVDATRQIRLHCIPPVLCLSLQRFVFDMKKLTKVKATDKLSIPLRLDVASILAMAGAQRLQSGTYEDAQYELMSILIHKGPSASHGHYVAHVWDAEAQKWWRCDDEAVTKMPKGPVAERGDHGGAPEKKAGAPPSKGKRKPKGLTAEEDPDFIEVTDAGAAAEPAMDPPMPSTPEEAAETLGAADRVVSSNAYMLVYRRCNWSSSPGSGPVKLPKSLRSVLEDERKEFEAACGRYKEEKQALMEQVQARRDAVRQVMETGVLPAAASPARWVPAEWLSQWANSSDNVPFPKDALLCKGHGKLDPNKVTEARRITPEAFQMLQQQVEGCLPLEDSDICLQCLMLRMQGFADAHQGTQQREEILDLLEAMEAEPDEVPQLPGPEDFYVSKSWLQGWRRRLGKTMSEQSPTQSITCPHDSLLPELAGARARRAAVPPVVWRHLQIAWRQACVDRRSRPRKAAKQQKSPASGVANPNGDVSDRDRHLNEREAAVALREQRVGGMDSDLLATFGDHPNGNSSASKEERYQAREAILEMRENAVAAKEAQALTEEAAHASSAGHAAPNGVSTEPKADVDKTGDPGLRQADAAMQPERAEQVTAQAACNGHAQPLGDGGDGDMEVVIMTDANGHTEEAEPQETLMEFKVGQSEECPVCIHEFSQDVSAGQHLREQAGTEKSLLAQLAANTAVHLEPGGRYALLPRPWLATWRAYIGASGKRSNMADVTRPGPLPEAVAETFCPCHAFLPEQPQNPVHLNIPPPSVVKRRGRWMQNAVDDDAFELVNLADWEHLMTFYGAESSLTSAHPANWPVEAVLEVEAAAAPTPAAPPAEPGQYEEAKLLKDEVLIDDVGKPLNVVPSARGADESARGHLITEPSLCQQAISERASAMRAAQLSYTDAPIHVEIVQAADLQKAPAAPTGERRSKRARRGEAEVKVSSSNTLWDFKLRLVEALSIHPKNADVHIRLGSTWQKLTNDEASLAELGMGQGQDVKVVHAGLVSDDDYASIVGGPHIPSAGGRAVEQGFAGTALADIPYSVISELQ